jgi:hypothetical protein
MGDGSNPTILDSIFASGKRLLAGEGFILEN